MVNSFTKQYLVAADTFGPAAEQATFTFVAVIRDDECLLIEGQLNFTAVDQQLKHSFRSAGVRAGQYRLSNAKKSISGFLEEVEAGRLIFPDGDILIPAHEGGCRWFYDPSHPAGGQSRVEVMTVLGIERESLIDERLVNWDLRAADPPFDTLIELTNSFGLAYVGGSIRFEAAVPTVIVVDLQQRVTRTQATLGLILMKGLDTDRAFLGYKVLISGNVVDRGRLSGSSFEWKDDGPILRGLATLQVPETAIVQCFAGYDGRAQSYGWIVDPNNHQNARRVAYETFDKDLTKLTEVLFREPGGSHKNRADDFEFAISWLLWIRGYATSLLGVSAIPGIKEGPDLLATTPAGHFAVIECTMGILKDDSKLTKVYGRANLVRQHLQNSGSPNLKVLPIMITSKTRAEVEAEIDGAIQLGVFVITREGIEEALASTFLVPDADNEFNRAMKFLADASTKQ
jgi:hypothetical protein